MKPEKLREFEAIFYPKSIAVVGASANENKPGGRWVRVLINRGFKGKVYPVNPSESTIFGLKTYPDVSSIPDHVDYVIIAVPRHLVLSILNDCAAKRVKAVQLFTAGFSEAGDEQGIRLEQEIVKKARDGGFRVIGPNCIGVYCPTINLPLGAEGLLGEAGATALIVQSGSLALRGVQSGITCGLHFSKVVSYGNGCDLDSTDFLEYFALDPETEVIGAYLEGAKDGRRLLRDVREISKKKPIVMWKGGRSEAGTKAATSHTGVLASPAFLWKAAFRQAGAIEVNSLEELIDTLYAFQQLSSLAGSGIAIISGLVDGGGGQTVAAADTCTELGLDIPPFSDQAKSQLKALVGEIGSILHNPLDISVVGSNVEKIRRVIEVAMGEEHISLIIVQENLDVMLTLLSKEWIEKIIDMLIELRKKQTKPIVMVLQPGLSEVERLAIARKLSQAKIPVFPTLERAARAIANMKRYFSYLEKISTEV